MSWIAEYDTQGREFPTCVHVTKTTGTMTHGVTYVPIEDGKAVRAENAKMRELVVLWSVINKHMSLCATTDCGQCPVRAECGESIYLEGLLGIDPKVLSWRVQKRMSEATDVQAANAKLREACADLLHMAESRDPEWLHWPEMHEELRKLGVEVK